MAATKYQLIKPDDIGKTELNGNCYLGEWNIPVDPTKGKQKDFLLKNLRIF